MAADPKLPISRIQTYPKTKHDNCDPSKGDLIYGHMPYDYNFISSQVLRDAPAVYAVVMLREPSRRIVSYANFLKIDVRSFEQKVERLACNQQTNLINGVPFSGGGCGVGVTIGEGFVNSWSHFRFSCRNNWKVAIEEGKRRLSDEFVAVGNVENFSASIFLLQRVFGWPMRAVEDALSHRASGFCMGGKCDESTRWTLANLHNNTRRTLQTRESCDYALWEHSKLLIESRLEAMSSEDVEAYGKFKAMATSRSASAQRKIERLQSTVRNKLKRLHITVRCSDMR